MVLFAVQILTCGLAFVTQVLFLTSWLETQVTGQHRSLQENYVFSKKKKIAYDLRDGDLGWEAPIHNATLHIDHVGTRGHMTNGKQNIFSSARPMATKPCLVVVYDEGTSPMMSHDPLTPWLHRVTWQIKTLISPLPKGLWSPNFAG